MVHVDAERFPLDSDVTEDVGDTALEEDRDDAGVRDLDEIDVVEGAGDNERDVDDRDNDLRRESLDTIG